MSEPQRDTREDKLLSSPEALTNIVRRIALDAGELVMDYFMRLETLEIEIKKDDSPVTEADQETEKHIRQALKQYCPTVPVIGEEAVTNNTAEAIKDKDDYFWLVDPLDGTRNFISGGEEFTVNIALVKNRQPVLGVVYLPVKEELYAGWAGGQALRWTAESKKDKPITVRDMPAQGLTVFSSRTYGDQSQMHEFLEQFKVQKIVKKSSSLKICAIAAGKADMYPRFGPTCEWDTAAGEAVLSAAGGYVTDTAGQPLVYGGSNKKWLNPEFVASSFCWSEEDA